MDSAFRFQYATASPSNLLMINFIQYDVDIPNHPKCKLEIEVKLIFLTKPNEAADALYRIQSEKVSQKFSVSSSRTGDSTRLLQMLTTTSAIPQSNESLEGGRVQSAILACSTSSFTIFEIVLKKCDRNARLHALVQQVSLIYTVVWKTIILGN